MGRKLKINHDHLWRYLVNGYKALYKERHTFFEGLAEVPTGATCAIENGRCGRAAALLGPARSDQRGDVLRRGRGRDARAAHPLDGIAPARRRAARFLHERRRRFECADRDCQAPVRLRRARLHHRQHRRALRRTRHGRASPCANWACATLRSRSTTDGFLDGCATLIRYHDAPVYTITYYAHWLLHGGDLPRQAIASRSAARRPTSCSPATTTTTSPICRKCSGDAAGTPRQLAAWQQHVQPLVRNPYLSDPDLFVDNRDFRDHIFLERRGVRGLSRVRRGSEALRRDALHRRSAAQPHAERAVPRGGAGDPARGRSQRHVLLDREPFAVSRPRPVRIRQLDPDPAPDPRRPAPRRCCAKPCAASRPTRSSTTAARSASTRRFSTFSTSRTPRCAAYLLDDSPIFDLVRSDRIERLIAKNGPAEQRKQVPVLFPQLQDVP